jgi:hypothetical protein
MATACSRQSAARRIDRVRKRPDPPRSFATAARPRHRLTCHHLLDQATERRARTRARPAWPWRGLAAGSGGGGSGPGPRSSRRPRSRTRLAPAARRKPALVQVEHDPRLGEEALAPPQCGVRRDAQALGHLLVLPTLRGCKHDPSPQHLPLLGLASAQTCLPRSRPASPAGSNAGSCSSDCSCPPAGRASPGTPGRHPASRRSRRLGRQEQVAVEAEEGLRAQHAQVCRPGVDLLGGQPLAADDEPGGDL